MAVQTIPEIDEMTAADQIDLMEALWKSMSKRRSNSEPPEWHVDYLNDREKAVAEGRDSFISIDDLENDLRNLVQ